MSADTLRILYCYTMTHNSGFAPHYGMPEEGRRVCTLACCKPQVRHSLGRSYHGKYQQLPSTERAAAISAEGVWLFGIAGSALRNALQHGPHACGELIRHYAPVYLMHVMDILTFDEYYEAYPFKRKNNAYGHADNIYHTALIQDSSKMTKSYFQSVGFGDTEEADFRKDIRGKYVLISTDYYNFNGGGIDAGMHDAYYPLIERLMVRVRDVKKKGLEELTAFLNSALDRGVWEQYHNAVAKLCGQQGTACGGDSRKGASCGGASCC